MQVSVEKTSELSRKMTVSVSEDVVQEKMAERLKSLVREIKMDGFRPGKVPPHVVKKMYGDRIRSEVTGDLIQSTFYQALQDQDLKPAGYPHIHPSDETNGFQYTAVFEVYPEVSLQGIDQLEIERPVATVEETDVDAMVEKLRVQRKSWNAVERASETGDRITITFSGSAEGENFTNGKVEDYSVEIGSKQMIPGFEDNLTGLAVGANKTFTVTFPDDYGNAQLAGKPADFEVDVVKVEEPVLPEVDETFIKAYGIQEGTVEAFREDVRNTMERELEQALRGNLKNAVMDVLYEKIQVTVPNALIDEEVESLMKPYKENARKRKVKLEDLQLPRDMFEEQARRRVALGLILGEVIKQNGIKVDNDKVRSVIEDMSRNYERPQDVIDWYYRDENRLSDVQQMVLEDQAVEWLTSQAKVTNRPMSFNDVMQNQQR
ncbi:trigger factor [Methylosarcina fibrata]|uniref:trigger factor n=1 Tax=Methylosarcina fibrata TaxID=105972 RepID=UPI0003A52906|nr:trigger factor [Methylosarcina fibrata]